jgi:5'-nucleotidase
MRVLLTNDDGVGSDGIAALRDRLINAGLSVTTVAPDEDSSGFARKCTYSRPVRVRKVLGGPNPIYSCDGSPTDCVRVGLLGGVAPDATWVASGINHGANLADDVLYSGTVGAGLEAAVLGHPAVCFSQQTPTGSFAVNYRHDASDPNERYEFSVSAAHAASMLAAARAIEHPRPLVLNVNYPTWIKEPRPQLTKTGQRHYPRSSRLQWPAGGEEVSLWLFGEPDEDIPDDSDTPDTDVAALRAGRISITTLSIGPGLDDGVATVDLRHELEPLLAVTAPSVGQDARRGGSPASERGFRRDGGRLSIEFS